ncbi:MAG: 50S ribosomal protein L2 [Halobacteriales archaeon SW_8_66_22]|nr:MAG: 50S ribosomal protein L2 [Halobacteriales archaeon SW_8_66_22]
MGRRIRGQRRGRGGPTFRAPSHRYKAELSHRNVEDGDVVTGEVVGIEHDPARSAPVADIQFDDGDRRLVLAPEGITVGDEIQVGVSARIEPGNTLPLAEIPEGVPVCNVEANPGDGGKYARASGVSATLLTHDRNVSVVQLPSGEMKRLDPQCRATAARGTVWPRVRGVAMNAVDHPFGGGGRQHPGKPKSISRDAPPGRKVGDISSRRTGRGGDT